MFHDEGYVVVPDVYDAADLQPLRDRLTNLIHEKAQQLRAEGKLSRLYE